MNQNEFKKCSAIFEIEMPTFMVRPKDCPPLTVKFDKIKMTIGRSSTNGICISDPLRRDFTPRSNRKAIKSCWSMPAAQTVHL